jgi:hypothetical protein
MSDAGEVLTWPLRVAARACTPAPAGVADIGPQHRDRRASLQGGLGRRRDGTSGDLPVERATRRWAVRKNRRAKPSMEVVVVTNQPYISAT